MQTTERAQTGVTIDSEFASDPELAEVLDQFVAGLTSPLAAMRNAFENDHMSEVIRLAHQLKGAGGSYGYPMLSDLAKVIESAAKASDLEAVKLALAN